MSKAQLGLAFNVFLGCFAFTLQVARVSPSYPFFLIFEFLFSFELVKSSTCFLLTFLGRKALVAEGSTDFLID